MKRVYAIEKRLTGFEHLKDEVKFNEVVTAPPVNLTKPKLVIGKKWNQGHKLDR
ncbi:unnamed protein product [Trichobilharzia regenti]|nr:unnamed protein product [Trichobilharzia regenti]